jgi:acetoin utilization deacetylase AcuC-like enzyme
MSTTRATGLVFHPDCLAHRPAGAHPESPARLEAVLRGIADALPQRPPLRIAPREATEDELELCHTDEYVATVRREVGIGLDQLSTGDTEISSGSWRAAVLAAGGVLAAADAVMRGEVRNAFCAVRPPGHHATPDRGMGFCIFNNVAIAARYLQRRHGLRRVLIVDWDVHHGNGTQEIFYADPSVFYFSTHAWPFYPGTGTVRETGVGAGNGYTLNCPLAAGSGRTEVLGAFKQKLVPAMAEFKPEFVLISAGFDARVGDTIGNFTLSDADFADLTAIVMSIAERYSQGRIVSVLEGGYDLAGLGSAAGAHVETLAEG